MAPRLARCTGLWGKADDLPGTPGLRRLGEAVYRPYADARGWGLFVGGRRAGGDGRDPGDGEALPAPEGEAEGPFLYVGPLAMHYGHFLTATLPRLWPLAGADPFRPWDGRRPRLLCHVAGPLGAWHGLAFMEAILGTLGFAPADIVAFDRPLRLRDVLVPEPAFREQAGMHAAFGALCRHVGRAFLREDAVDTEARPVYLAKTRLRAGIARIANEAEIVAELELRGCAIAYPETLTFAEQVGLLNRHRVVTGSVGSAFHTVAFAAPGRRLVGLNWQPALNANFPLLERVNGARARHYFPLGTRYGEAPGWEVSWTVEDPRGLARALLRRADWLARGEPDGTGLAAEAARRALRPVRALRAVLRG